MIGLLQEEPESWFKRTVSGISIDAEWVRGLLDERIAARAAKNFARADQIRKELANNGVEIEDSAEGTRWKAVQSAE